GSFDSARPQKCLDNTAADHFKLTNTQLTHRDLSIFGTNPVPGFQGTLVILFPGVPVSHPGLIGSPASPAKSARVPCQRQSEASAPPCQSKPPLRWEFP